MARTMAKLCPTDEIEPRQTLDQRRGFLTWNAAGRSDATPRNRTQLIGISDKFAPKLGQRHKRRMNDPRRSFDAHRVRGPDRLRSTGGAAMEVTIGLAALGVICVIIGLIDFIMVLRDR